MRLPHYKQMSSIDGRKRCPACYGEQRYPKNYLIPIVIFLLRRRVPPGDAGGYCVRIPVAHGGTLSVHDRVNAA